MNPHDFFREGHTVRKDGEIEIEMLTVDGIGLPEFPPATQPGGYPKRLNEIINMDTHPNDIILATYPKNGMSIYIFIFYDLLIVSCYF